MTNLINCLDESHFYRVISLINFAFIAGFNKSGIFIMVKKLTKTRLLSGRAKCKRQFSTAWTVSPVMYFISTRAPALAYYSLLFIMLTVWPSRQSSAQNTLSLTLEEAVQLALANNPEVDIAAKQTISSEIAIREARGNFLPKVTLNGTYTRNIDKPVIFFPETFGGVSPIQIGSNNNFVTYLDLSVPLYSKFNLTTRHVAYRSLGLQQEVLTGQQQNVVANVRKGYYSYLVSLEVVRVREKGLENAIENLVNTTEKAAQGVATEFDVTSAEVKVATARNNLLEAQSQVIPAADNLRLLLGLNMETSLALEDSLSLTEDELMISENPDDLLNNSNLKQQELKLEITREQTLQVKSSYYPVLSGVGTYQYQSQHNDFNFSKYSWVQTSSLGLRLQVPLFNGTVTRNKVQQSVMNEEIAEVQREYTEVHNQSKYRQLLSELRYIRQRISVQSGNISLTEKALLLVKERFHYGRSSMLEVNSAELDYITARLNYLQAIADYKAAYYDYQLLTGQ